MGILIGPGESTRGEMALRIFPSENLGSGIHLVMKQTGTGGKLFNGIRVALPGALSPYLAPLGLVLGFS